VRKLSVALLLVTLPFTASAVDSCQFTAARSVDIDAAGLKTLQATLGTSDMEIESAPGLAKIEIRGTACASDAARLKDLLVDGHRSGDNAILDATSKGGYANFSMFGSTYAYLKLKVRVPPSVAVTIVTGSGDVNASNLASLDYTAGSGDLIANHINGALNLKLGSSDAKATQVGSVDLKSTGSGDVSITGVHGDVRSGKSGSGNLDFSNVAGDVSIGSTGSGDITLKDIGRNVDIGSTASGDVNADGVGGSFTVHTSGGGDVRQSHVKGKVSVPKHGGDDD
jgi:DUF4097 and DUF4098 domain-containing protein YvlB